MVEGMKEVYELEDGRYLIIKVIEIEALAEILETDQCKKKAKSKFNELINILYHASGGLPKENFSYEVLWLPEKVEHQLFESRVHIYFLIRGIGKQRTAIESSVQLIEKNISEVLRGLGHRISLPERLQNIIEFFPKTEHPGIYAVEKCEKWNVNSAFGVPYYYSEIMPLNNEDDMSLLVNALSSQRECGISFTIFPASFTVEEKTVLSQYALELEQMVSGVLVNGRMLRDHAAEEPLKVYSYYSGHRTSPVFLYNLLIFGKKELCNILAAKLIGFLKAGNEAVVNADYCCIDLTSERIDMKKDFASYPWNINALLLYKYRNKKIRKIIPLSNSMHRLPFVITEEEAAAFFRIPYYNERMLGIQGNRIENSAEEFSADITDKNNIHIGWLERNGTQGIQVGCVEASFTKHALVVGTPGSGKTTFSIHLLLQFAEKGIPFLAVEPTKKEYRALLDIVPELRVFTPGNSGVSPFIINPFVPPTGVTVEQYIPSLVSAFRAAFSMPSPLDMIFLKAVRRCYVQYGWKDYSTIHDKDIIKFGLYEFILVFKKAIRSMDYSREIRGNIESAGLLRLMNLIEQNSNIYDTIHTIPVEDLLSTPVVLELNAIENTEQKALIMALLLINICTYIKNNENSNGKLKNVVLIDEAHVLLSPAKGDVGNDGFSTVRALQDMIAEIRAYGTGVIIADQAPSKVSREIVANTDIKVAFRLVEETEKKMIADTTNMDQLMYEKLSVLKTGQAYFYFSHLEKPQLVWTDDIRTSRKLPLNLSDEYVRSRMFYWEDKKEFLKPYMECRDCPECTGGCDIKIRADAEFIADSVYDKHAASIKGIGDVKKILFFLPVLARSDFMTFQEEHHERLCICARIKLYRKIRLVSDIQIDRQEREKIFYTFPDWEMRKGE